MRIVSTCLVAALLCAALPMTASADVSAILALQVEPRTTAPEETTAAAWATFIWIALGVIFLVLLIGAVLLAVRSTRGSRIHEPRHRMRE